jgi:predicted transcriptional regulator
MRTATAVHQEAPLSAVSWCLAMSGAHVAFVVDDDYRPIGLVSPTHLLHSASGRDRNALRNMTARDAVQGPLVRIENDATLEQAAKKIADYGVRWLAVCEDGKLRGCLSAEDVYQTVWASSRWSAVRANREPEPGPADAEPKVDRGNRRHRSRLRSDASSDFRA